MGKYIILFLCVLVSFGVVWLATLILSFNRHSRVKWKQLENDTILKRALGRLNAWLIAATFWMVLEYLFVIIPFIANVIVIYLSTERYPSASLILIYSAISLSFIVFGYSINPQRHKKSYRKAYDVLDIAINNYLLSPAPDISLKETLAKAISDGERYIDASYDVE